MINFTIIKISSNTNDVSFMTVSDSDSDDGILLFVPNLENSLTSTRYTDSSCLLIFT